MNTITRTLDATFTGRHGWPVPLRTALSYYPADPYAVYLSFPDGDSHYWRFARDLLTDGMSRPAGMGDVQIWPTDLVRPRWLRVRLCSPDGCAVLTVPARQAEAFLADTARLVPPGTESMHVDVDAWIAQLLGERA